MKTDELIRVLAQECKVRVVVTPDFNNIYCYSLYSNKNGEDDWWFKLGSLNDLQANLTINEGCCIKQHYAKTLKYIAEYLDTPLEEREEEKKYRLKVNVNNYQCLNFYTVTKSYIISNLSEAERYITKFTQKEIDDMPFDTNFFIKEEVK